MVLRGCLGRRAAVLLLMFAMSSGLTACGGGDGGSSMPASAAASAGAGSSSSASTSSTSIGTNRAPTIGGSPTTSLTVGSVYSFTPVAADADGNTLSFSIANRPAWATFNTLTGGLTGTPTTAGSYANIIISVSDGQASTALPAFAITVNATSATGTATLSWTPPTLNTDGSTLTDLAGYTIYYGTNPGNLSSTVGINSAGATSYTISGLTKGTTYYFALASVNATGISSPLSDVASKTI